MVRPIALVDVEWSKKFSRVAWKGPGVAQAAYDFVSMAKRRVCCPMTQFPGTAPNVTLLSHSDMLQLTQRLMALREFEAGRRRD